MALFTLSRGSATMNTSNDLITIISASARKLVLVDILIGGTGATSAAAAYCEVAIYRSTGGTTGGAALTARAWETEQGAAAFTNFTTWAAQPSLSGDPYYRLPFQNYGGVVGKPIKPIGPLVIRNTEQISIRPISGTSAITLSVVVDEL
jgi:hypothetical protein